jgi:hypothetical protein
MSISAKKLVIYIPAYFDYESAVAQSRLIQKERPESNLQIHVVISVNAVSLSATAVQDLIDSCDEFVYFSENLGGDTNINLGFLKALSLESDFLWILSANDLLLPGAIKMLTEYLENFSEDLAIIFRKHKNQTGSIDNAFLGEGADLPIGLISAVVYRVSNFKDSFANALKFSWTGWGQLSVIQNSLFERGKLSYKILNQDEIYDRKVRISESNERMKNQSNYRHSFFGYPLVIALLFGNDVKLRDTIIRGWLRNNWYKIGFFKGGHSPYLESGATVKDVFWTEQLSKQFIVGSSPAARILYFLGSLSRFSKLQNVPLLERIRVKLYTKNRSKPQ